MKVNALFYVYSTTRIVQGPGAGNYNLQVVLMPVTRNVSKEPHSSANPNGTYESPNVDWSQYTPSGKIEMTITAKGARDWFEEHLGQDIPITFG